MTKLKKFGFFYDDVKANKTDEANIKHELSELMRDDPHPMEQNILHYLNGGRNIAYIMGPSEDFLAPSKKNIRPPHIYTDGTWAWTSDVMYYVEKYHIQLPDDFLAHMERNKWHCPRVDKIDRNDLN